MRLRELAHGQSVVRGIERWLVLLTAFLKPLRSNVERPNEDGTVRQTVE